MTESTALAPIEQVREELAPMKANFSSLLPSHITADKFAQVCITAIENNPDLLMADRQSFKVACMNAATDGLLPDKREGAFVIFNTEVDYREEGKAATYKKKVKLVQWMPMITGILKKAYQTNKVASIAVEMVHKNDLYRRAAGDDAQIVHEPLDFGDRGPVIGGYTIVTMLTGAVYREVMDLAQIEAVRAVSRAKQGGPWFTFWEEMAKKTILRRALKRVPLSAEVDQVLARDDVFYNLEGDKALPRAGVASAITSQNIFGGRAAVRRRAQPLEIEDASTSEADAAQSDLAPDGGAPVGEDGGDQVAGEVDESALVAALATIRDAADLTSLLEATQAAEALAQDDGERAWVQETMVARRAALMPAQPFELTAIISSEAGPKVYEDPDLWVNDILTKMSAIAGDPLKVFWKKNLPHILDAGENGFDAQAERLLEVAGARGLPTEIAE